MAEKTTKYFFNVKVPAGIKSTFTRKEIRTAVETVKNAPKPASRPTHKVIFAHS